LLAVLLVQAGLFCRLLTPGLWCGAYFMALQKYWQVQNVLLPAVWISLLANIYNIAGNYLFIWTFKLGFVGSPIATSSSRFFMLIALTCYTIYRYASVRCIAALHPCPFDVS
jgi:MATE family multidrug resistance protein